VSKGVIDSFEVVHIDKQESKFRVGRRLEFVAKALKEVATIGKSGEDISKCHVFDFLIGAPSLGYILVGRYPAAAGHWPINDLNRSTVRQIQNKWSASLGQVFRNALAIGVDIANQ
jgi:hypothetical protein